MTRLRMAFPKENDDHGHDRLSFCFWFQILLLYGGYPQRSPVWILRERETPFPGRSCTSTASAGNHHTRLRHFLGGIAHRRSKKSKRKARTLMAYTSATSTLGIKQWNARTTRDRSFFTRLQTRTSIRNEWQ